MIRPLLCENDVKFLVKKPSYLLFPFTCNTRNVVSATLSTVITALMGE